MKLPNVFLCVIVNVLSRNYIFCTTELNFGMRKKNAEQVGRTHKCTFIRADDWSGDFP